MLVENSVLYENVKKACLRYAKDKKKLTEFVGKLEEKYNLPPSISNDILTCRKDADQFSDQVLFWVISVVAPKKVEEYFTKKEIENYSADKYVIEELKFPLEYQMVQVTDSQWIGVITYDELMRLRNAQVVHYNPKAQRPLVYVNKGVTTYYRLDINTNSVNAMGELMLSGRYIPDTLTFNMPEDTDFEYKNGKLIIYSISYFDILDGYHRYVAINKAINEDPTVQGVMELRITTFPLEIERQFIYQTEQKNHMTKITSEIFNQYNPANQIMDALKKKPSFERILSEQIIDEGVLLELLTVAYVKKGEQLTRKDVIDIREKIYDGFDAVFDEHPELADKPLSNKQIVVLFTAIYCNVPDVYTTYIKVKDMLMKLNRSRIDYMFTKAQHIIREEVE